MQLNTTICKENTDYLGLSCINVAQMDTKFINMTGGNVVCNQNFTYTDLMRSKKIIKNHLTVIFVRDSLSIQDWCFACKTPAFLPS